MRIVKAFLILIIGLALFMALPPLVNNMVHDALFDSSRGLVNEKVAFWAAMAGGLVKGVIAVIAVRLAYNEFKPIKSDAQDHSVDTNGNTDQSSQERIDRSRMTSMPTAAYNPGSLMITQPSASAEPEEPAYETCTDHPEALPESYNSVRKKARIVLEYNPNAALAWERVESLPERYREEFLSGLEASPMGDPECLALSLETQYQRELRPLDSDEANDAFEQAGTISAEARSEFREVYQVLGAIVPPHVILSKIENRFGPSANTRLREVERIEGERLEAERRSLQEAELYRAEAEQRIAERAEEERVAAARRARRDSEAIELFRVNAKKRAVEELEIMNSKLADDEAREQAAAERAELFYKRLAFLGRHQLHILMICLLALLYWAFASV